MAEKMGDQVISSYTYQANKVGWWGQKRNWFMHYANSYAKEVR